MITDKSLEVSKSLYRIDQVINGNVFKVNVDDLISSDTTFSDMSTEEAEDQLNNSAYYQATWISAIKFLVDKRNEVKLDYSVWYAEKSEEAERTLLDRDLKRVENGEITKGNVKRASKTESDNWILTNYELEHRGHIEELNKLNNSIEIYKEFLTTFRKRGDDLRLLLKEDRSTHNNSSPTISSVGVGSSIN